MKRSLYNPQITSFTFPLSSAFIQVRFPNCQKQPDYFYSCRKAILLISRYYVSWLLLHHSIGRASEDAGKHAHTLYVSQLLRDNMIKQCININIIKQCINKDFNNFAFKRNRQSDLFGHGVVFAPRQLQDWIAE